LFVFEKVINIAKDWDMEEVEKYVSLDRNKNGAY